MVSRNSLHHVPYLTGQCGLAGDRASPVSCILPLRTKSHNRKTDLKHTASPVAYQSSIGVTTSHSGTGMAHYFLIFEIVFPID